VSLFSVPNHAGPAAAKLRGVGRLAVFQSIEITRKELKMAIIYHVKHPVGESLKPGENILVWFSDSPIKDCRNAMVLYGGDVLLLKTVEQISQKELLDLIDDNKKWVERFGEGATSEQLRTGVRQSDKVNQ
jgi:hypothetical protein